MQVSRRGKFSTLTTRDGAPLRAEVYACTVLRETTNGRNRFVTLDLTTARGAGVDVLRRADDVIRREANPGFSPLTRRAGEDGGGTVIAKLAGDDVRFETWDGGFAVPFDLVPGMCVDVELRLGAFGAFGYCWLLERVKPHAAAETGDE